jgi:hypothetical protein
MRCTKQMDVLQGVPQGCCRECCTVVSQHGQQWHGLGETDVETERQGGKQGRKTTITSSLAASALTYLCAPAAALKSAFLAVDG